MKLWWVEKTYCKDAKSGRVPKKRCNGLFIFLIFFFGGGPGRVVDCQKNRV